MKLFARTHADQQQLARLGAEIVTARLQTLAEMAPFVAEAYLAIAPSNNVATVAYRSSSLGLDPGPGEGVEGPILEATPEEVAAHLRTRMEDRRNEEIARGVTLVDFKLEFGKDSKGNLMLADEVSPDTCRFWDSSTGDRLDKDRFRKDLGNVLAAYEEIWKRISA